MSIVLSEKESLFTLYTKTSMYQMKVDDYGVLLHTYYGKKTEVFDYSYLIQRRDHGFSGNPFRRVMTGPTLWTLSPRNIPVLEAEITARAPCP